MQACGFFKTSDIKNFVNTKEENTEKDIGWFCLIWITKIKYHIYGRESWNIILSL